MEKCRNELHRSHEQLNMSKTFINHHNIEPWTAKEFLWKCAPSHGQGDFNGEGKQKQKWKIILFSTDFVSDSAVELMIKRMAASNEP